MKKMALQLYHAQPGDDVSRLQSNLANRANKEKSRAAETRKVPRSPSLSARAALARTHAHSHAAPVVAGQGQVQFPRHGQRRWRYE